MWAAHIALARQTAAPHYTSAVPVSLDRERSAALRAPNRSPPKQMAGPATELDRSVLRSLQVVAGSCTIYAGSRTPEATAPPELHRRRAGVRSCQAPGAVTGRTIWQQASLWQAN